MLTAKQISSEAKAATPSGNAAPFFQPKLSINQPGDPYEQEADAMADQVMRMKDKAVDSPFFKPSVSSIQRKCHHCEEGEKLRRREINNESTEVSAQTENYISSLSGGGRHLDEKERNFFEPRMGYDFSQVRLHTDAVAATSAQSINALAYTSGNNIVFNSGQYSSVTDSGKRLLGHELTHVVQQSSGMPLHTLRKTPQNLQRLCAAPPRPGIGNAAPSEPCTRAGNNTVAGTQIHFCLDSTQIVDADIGIMSSLILGASTASSISIHGNASSDGPTASYDLNVACQRASFIASTFRTAGISVPITLFSHGPVTAYGSAAANRVVVVNLTSSPQTEVAPQTSCGPTITNWFVNIMNNAKTHPTALAIKTDLDRARMGGARYGYSSSDVIEGGLSRRVLAAAAAVGHPARTADASRQLAAADPHNQFGASLLAAASPIPFAGAPEQMMLLLIRRAGSMWVSMVQTGAVWDFKNNILSGASLASANCTNPCTNPPTVTICGTCYEHDLPGNLFYAYIGKFLGFSLNALQLGSQFAELLPTSSSNWDTPEDTAAINLGFGLPATITQSNLCSALTAAGTSITVRPCSACAAIHPQ